MKFFSQCKCHGRRFCVRAAMLYPIFLLEHFVAEKVWPLTILTHALGI